MIYELGSTEEDSLSEVSGGICIGLDETELENILNNANIEYDKTIDTSEDGDKESKIRVDILCHTSNVKMARSWQLNG